MLHLIDSCKSLPTVVQADWSDDDSDDKVKAPRAEAADEPDHSSDSSMKEAGMLTGSKHSLECLNKLQGCVQSRHMAGGLIVSQKHVGLHQCPSHSRMMIAEEEQEELKSPPAGKETTGSDSEAEIAGASEGLEGLGLQILSSLDMCLMSKTLSDISYI